MKGKNTMRALALLAAFLLTASAASCQRKESPGSSPSAAGGTTVSSSGESTGTAESTADTSDTAPTESSAATTAKGKTTAGRTTATQAATRESTPTGNPTGTGTASGSGEKENTAYLAKNSQIGFGFYHLFPDGITPDFEKMLQSNFVNTVILSGQNEISEGMPLVKKYKCRAWTGGGSLFNLSPVGSGIKATLNPNYKRSIDNVIKWVKATGCYDNWLGFYFDEPMMWLVSNEMMNTVTKYMHEAAPDKRIFVCFSVAGIDGKSWTVKGAEEIDKTGSRYLTDVAFDVYGKYDEAEYARLTKCMLDKMYDSNVKVWYIPGTMEVSGITSEAMAVAHFDGLVNLLKKQKNPGGIMNFTYRFVGGDTVCAGISDHVSFFEGCGKTTNWPTMKTRIETVGKDICTGKLFGK